MTWSAGRHWAVSLSFVWITVLLMSAGAAEPPVWELTEERDGIRVYTRPIPDQDFHEFMGVGLVEAPIEALYHLLLDIESFPMWFPRCRQATMIEPVDAHTRIFWYVMDAPWPISDRDVVLRTSSCVDWRMGRVEFQLASVDDARRPPAAPRVRMRSMRGGFVLEYQGRTQTLVTYTIRVDPSGPVPSALANAGSGKSPLPTLLGMRRMATRERYRIAAASSGDTHTIDELVSAGMLSP